jgi:hypothetical protein
MAAYHDTTMARPAITGTALANTTSLPVAAPVAAAVVNEARWATLTSTIWAGMGTSKENLRS